MPVTKTNLKKITVEFDDGTTQTWILPVETGFVKEEFTYEAKPNASGLSKWGNKIKMTTIFWAEAVTDECRSA